MLGPWQIRLMLIILAILIPILLIILLVRNSKNKAKAETLGSVRKEETQSNKLDQLEKLNQLKESGALTEEEFAEEKRKVLNK